MSAPDEQQAVYESCHSIRRWLEGKLSQAEAGRDTGTLAQIAFSGCWLSNAARRKLMKAMSCPDSQIPKDARNKLMQEIVQKVGEMLGWGVYGIDLIEGKEGECYVLEVNHAPEFSKSSGEKIGEVAGKIVQFAVSQAKN